MVKHVWNVALCELQRYLKYSITTTIYFWADTIVHLLILKSSMASHNSHWDRSPRKKTFCQNALERKITNFSFEFKNVFLTFKSFGIFQHEMLKSNLPTSQLKFFLLFSALDRSMDAVFCKTQFTIRESTKNQNEVFFVRKPKKVL